MFLRCMIWLIFTLTPASVLVSESKAQGSENRYEETFSAFDWQGFYLGGHIGHGRTIGKDNAGFPVPEGEPVFGRTSVTLKAAFGGAHAGYNHVHGNYLVGIEGEVNFLNFNGKTSFGSDVDVDWLLAGRVRAGLTFDRFLAFVTTGLSVTDVKSKNLSLGRPADSDTHAGFVLGLGGEAFITEKISTRLEYQHHRLINVGHNDFHLDGRLDFIRAGAAYHF